MATKDKKIGKQTVKLENPPKIISTYSIVGPKEGDGPLRKYFHKIISDDTLGKDSFEKAESEMMYTAIREAIKGANLTEDKIDYLFAGDLLNQITSSSFAARELNIPFIWSMFYNVRIIKHGFIIFRWRFWKLYCCFNIFTF